MISNSNKSKTASNGESFDIQLYTGVASISVLAINPTNATLRKYGWNISEDAPEPSYTLEKEDGNKTIRMSRLRFLVQIQDLKDKPVISLDFWCRPDLCLNRDGSKAKFIDEYVRTAWGTQADFEAKRAPMYSSGEASISWPYHICHRGEEEVLNFLHKLLNITPLQVFDRASKAYVATKDPGKLTIDDWKKICSGDMKEIAYYISRQPDNCVKVILGVHTTEDNRSYQTFLNSRFLSNAAFPDKNSGEYTAAANAIAKFNESTGNSASYIFSAAPVAPWKPEAADVKDNSETLFDTTENHTPMFDENGNYALDDGTTDDLPFFEA